MVPRPRRSARRESAPCAGCRRDEQREPVVDGGVAAHATDDTGSRPVAVKGFGTSVTAKLAHPCSRSADSTECPSNSALIDSECPCRRARGHTSRDAQVGMPRIFRLSSRSYLLLGVAGSTRDSSAERLEGNRTSHFVGGGKSTAAPSRTRVIESARPRALEIPAPARRKATARHSRYVLTYQPP